MTPYELSLFTDVHKERQKAESEERITIAWLTAYYKRIEKMPKLDDVLRDVNKKPREKKTTPMSDDQMLDVVKQLNKAFGGSVE